MHIWKQTNKYLGWGNARADSDSDHPGLSVPHSAEARLGGEVERESLNLHLERVWQKLEFVGGGRKQMWEQRGHFEIQVAFLKGLKTIRYNLCPLIHGCIWNHGIALVHSKCSINICWLMNKGHRWFWNYFDVWICVPLSCEIEPNSQSLHSSLTHSFLYGIPSSAWSLWMHHQVNLNVTFSFTF